MRNCRVCLFSPCCVSGSDKIEGAIEFKQEKVSDELGPILADKSGMTKDNGRDYYIEALKSGTTLQVQIHRFQEGEKCFVPVYW